MTLGADIERDWRYLTGLGRTLLRVRSITPHSANLITDDLEAAVDRWTRRRAIAFRGRELSYGECEALANRYADWAQSQGLKRGETAALFLPNRLEYLPLWFGFSKIGVVSALINNQLTGAGLAHCLELSGARRIIVDSSTAGGFADLGLDFDVWDLDERLAPAVGALDPRRPARSVRAGMTARDDALLIYTSGATGLPKAARINHMRAQLYMRGFAGATDAGPNDRLYLTLPLYHATGGLCATGAALLNGASIALRDTFSASQFWEDVRSEGATMFAYVGELCRYLANQPPAGSDGQHTLRLAFGNGLSQEVWSTLETRFGVPRILEFYGSTEGNVSLFNFDGGLGAIGRIPPWLAPLFNVALARFDAESETPVRGVDGFCQPCDDGEAGECLGAIRGDARTAYTGYVDKSASAKKVLRNAFRQGDAWFRTGDLIRRDRAGYLYFVDRVGDTYRWKGENVSTREVAEVLMATPGVKQAAVYGVAVPHNEGRAGMAAVVAEPNLDLEALRRWIEKSLPAYAQPLFLRMTPGLAVTGTFKPRKLDLVAEGFDPVKVNEPLYFHDRAEGFVPLTGELWAEIQSGALRI